MQVFKTIIVIILTLESRLIVKKYKPFIVAVTGSVGKTTTKDAVYNILKDQSEYVRKSDKSMNSEIGLPLTIIGAPNAWHSLGGWLKNIGKGFGLIVKNSPYPDCLILEIGADHPGDIKKVAKWLHPDIVVMTKISRTPVHVEFFKSPEEVFEEKAALVTSVKTGGVVVLYGDEENTISLAERVKGKNVTVITYGLNENTTVKGSGEKIVYESFVGESNNLTRPVGFTFNLNIEGNVQSIIVRNVVGTANIYPLLAAASVGKSRGMPIEEIAKLSSQFEAPKGRMNVISGINNSTIIDDTYNSSPDAVLSALQTLKILDCSGSKIAVLGDMMELGKFAVEEHRRVGRAVFGSALELVVVGLRSHQTGEEAISSGLPKEMVHTFNTSVEAASYLVSKVKSGDIILVKGSQSMRMERVSMSLLKEHEKADRLLVRQEKEWLEKK